MFRELLTAATLACVVALGVPTGGGLVSAAQNPVSKVGKATKDVGKGAVKGASEGVKTTGEVTKDAADKTVTETKNAGNTAKGAVNPNEVSAKCKDGTVHTGKTKAEACANHGGLKK